MKYKNTTPTPARPPKGGHKATLKSFATYCKLSELQRIASTQVKPAIFFLIACLTAATLSSCSTTPPGLTGGTGPQHKPLNKPTFHTDAKKR